jgi:SAM-dependent methyltransferase
LNSKEFAILQYGDSVSRAVPLGHHVVRIHNTMLWKAIEFDLAAGEHAEFSALNRAGWGTYGIATFLGAGPVYLDVSRVR